MTYTIRLTPSQLRGKAQDIDSNAKIVQKEVAGVEALINQLKPTFLGETASEFFKDFNQARGNMERWDDVVRSFAVEIREAADRLERADRS
ncbi:MAG TPA: WXG100 family type VII secretion target [Anaerolineales bacterium]|nr:WXG100 family type VII secretion target [Anaerolineales bacterium]